MPAAFTLVLFNTTKPQTFCIITQNVDCTRIELYNLSPSTLGHELIDFHK